MSLNAPFFAKFFNKLASDHEFSISWQRPREATHELHITDGTVHDVNILDQFLAEAGAFYVMDRGYIDFERLSVFTLCLAFFVVRTKENILLQRRYSSQPSHCSGQPDRIKASRG